MERIRVMDAGCQNYERPEIVDHGTLLDLTQSFELDFGVGVAKFVTMAVVSIGPGSADILPGSADILPTGGTPDAGDLQGDVGQGPGATPPGDLVPTGDEAVARGDEASAGAGKATKGQDEVGRLPFTGSLPMVTAAFGATIASTGLAIRTLLRRRS